MNLRVNLLMKLRMDLDAFNESNDESNIECKCFK